MEIEDLHAMEAGTAALNGITVDYLTRFGQPRSIVRSQKTRHRIRIERLWFSDSNDAEGSGLHDCEPSTSLDVAPRHTTTDSPNAVHCGDSQDASSFLSRGHQKKLAA